MSTDKPIFVVIGAAGEYNDKNEWLVAAYLNEAAAIAHAEAATAYARETRSLISRIDHLVKHSVGAQRVAANPWDKNELQLTSLIGDDAAYSVMEVPLRDRIPVVID